MCLHSSPFLSLYTTNPPPSTSTTATTHHRRRHLSPPPPSHATTHSITCHHPPLSLSLSLSLSLYSPPNYHRLPPMLTLSHHLNLNRLLSYKHAPDSPDSDCVVCLNHLTAGEHVRKLPCHYVFHKECFDGWLHHFNFNCPLCRSPMVFDECVVVTPRRQWWFMNDVISWFDFRR
ncbi:putative transcription factor C2H2 family [Helianthus annuus]|nr:putative transcription factor C2H2 family [Helianthus annuus]